MKYVWYHRGDHDGVLAGYLACDYYDAEPLPLEYPEIDKIDPAAYQPVAVVDLSLTKKRAKRIAGHVLTWVDHHETSRPVAEKPPKSWRVIWESGNRSALRLMVEEHGVKDASRFPNLEWIVRLISDYDTMSGDVDTAAAFELALRQDRKERYGPRWFDCVRCAFARDVLVMNTNRIRSLIHRGHGIIEDEVSRTLERGAIHHGIFCVEGDVSAYVIRRVMQEMGLSIALRIRQSEGIAAIFTNPPLAASDIARELGGGGHRHAAGFSFPPDVEPREVAQTVADVLEIVSRT